MTQTDSSKKLPTTAYDVLVAAKEVIKDEANWVKRHMFFRYGGRDCFCSIGAVAKAGGIPLERGADKTLRIAFGFATWSTFQEDKGIALLRGDKLTPNQKAINKAIQYLEAAAVSIYGGFLPWDTYLNTHAYRVNDATEVGHDDVMKMFDLAIKAAKRRHLPKAKKNTSDVRDVAAEVKA